MTLLKTDDKAHLKTNDKAQIPPPPVIPSPPVTPAPAKSGEPTPEQIWREPAGGLLARLKTKIEGLTTAEFKSRLASYGANDASDVKTAPLWRQFLVRFENPLIIILLIAAAVSALTGGVGQIRRHRRHRADQRGVRLRPGCPGAKCGGLPSRVGVRAGDRQTRRQGRLGSDQPIGARRYRRIGRRRSRSRRFAFAREPRPLCQPGAADRRALSRRETGRRRRFRRRKTRPARPMSYSPAPPSSAGPRRSWSAGPEAGRRSGASRAAWRRSPRPPTSRWEFVALAC